MVKLIMIMMGIAVAAGFILFLFIITYLAFAAAGMCMREFEETFGGGC